MSYDEDAFADLAKFGDMTDSEEEGELRRQPEQVEDTSGIDYSVFPFEAPEEIEELYNSLYEILAQGFDPEDDNVHGVLRSKYKVLYDNFIQKTLAATPYISAETKKKLKTAKDIFTETGTVTRNELTGLLVALFEATTEMYNNTPEEAPEEEVKPEEKENIADLLKGSRLALDFKNAMALQNHLLNDPTSIFEFVKSVVFPFIKAANKRYNLDRPLTPKDLLTTKVMLKMKLGSDDQKKFRRILKEDVEQFEKLFAKTAGGARIMAHRNLAKEIDEKIQEIN